MTSPSKEVEVTKHEIVNPTTGVLVDLATGSIDELAEFQRDLDAIVERVGEVRELINAEWIRRADREVTDTLTGDDFEVSVPSRGSNTTWNLDRLRETLAELVKEGHISQSASDELLVTKTKTTETESADALKLRKVTARDDAVGDRVRACSTTLPKNRTPKIKGRDLRP